jgi:hypothetical protein
MTSSRTIPEIRVTPVNSGRGTVSEDPRIFNDAQFVLSVDRFWARMRFEVSHADGRKLCLLYGRLVLLMHPL